MVFGFSFLPPDCELVCISGTLGLAFSRCSIKAFARWTGCGSKKDLKGHFREEEIESQRGEGRGMESGYAVERRGYRLQILTAWGLICWASVSLFVNGTLKLPPVDVLGLNRGRRVRFAKPL